MSQDYFIMFRGGRYLEGMPMSNFKYNLIEKVPLNEEGCLFLNPQDKNVSKSVVDDYRGHCIFYRKEIRLTESEVKKL